MIRKQLLELRETSMREIDFHYWKFHEDEKIKGDIPGS